MRGLVERNGFIVGIKGKPPKRRGSRIFMVTIMVILVLSSVFAITLYSAASSSKPKFSDIFEGRAVNQDLGAGYKNPQVVALGNYFIAGTINYGKITIIFINGTDGSIYGAISPAVDGNNKYFSVCSDPANKVLMVAWINGSSYLNGTFIYLDGSGNLAKTDNFTITDNVGTTLFGVTYGYGEFLVVWSDSGNHNHGRIVKYNTNNPSNPTLGNIFDISQDTHSHADNFVAYDSTTKHFLVLWRNYSGITGKYNITGKIFDVNGNAVTGDFLVADGVAANTKFDYPSAEGGPGRFLVGYMNYNSPYDIHGVIVDASDGSIIKSFSIGNTDKYGVSLAGIAYNGNSYIVTWTNESYDIVAMTYDTNGNALLNQPLAIANTSDSEEWQDVAYNNETGNYYFVWYDYTQKHDFGSLWTHSEISEFSTFLPIITVLAVAFFVYRRRR